MGKMITIFSVIMTMTPGGNDSYFIKKLSSSRPFGIILLLANIGPYDGTLH